MKETKKAMYYHSKLNETLLLEHNAKLLDDNLKVPKSWELVDKDVDTTVMDIEGFDLFIPEAYVAPLVVLGNIMFFTTLITFLGWSTGG